MEAFVSEDHLKSIIQTQIANMKTEITEQLDDKTTKFLKELKSEQRKA